MTPSSRSSNNNNSKMMIRRDQHQIRAQFLNALGIVRDTKMTDSMSPAAVVQGLAFMESGQARIEDAAPNTTNTRRRQQAQHEPLKYNPQEKDLQKKPTSQQQGVVTGVSFCDSVAVFEIPSHRDYDANTRQDLWNGASAVSEIVQRNTVEYTAEGWAFCGVLEEDAFVRLPSGDLIHPATYQRQLAIKDQRRRLRRKSKDKYAYKSVAQCLSFISTAPPPIKGKSRQSTRSRRRKNARRNLVVVASQ